MTAKDSEPLAQAKNPSPTTITLRLRALMDLAFRHRTTSGALAAILLLAVGLAFFLNRPAYVPVAKIERNVEIKVFGLGTVEARIFSRIGFKIAGTLVALHADHGDRVRAGQLLARIDDREQRARVAKAEAQLLSADAAVHTARAVASKTETQLAQRVLSNRRRQELLAKQSISTEAAEESQLTENVARADVQVARAELTAAEARLKDAQAQFEYEKAILSQHDLIAPFDGVVILRAKELGSILPATEPLFTVVAPETVWILAYVDEARSGDVRVGQPVSLKLRSIPNATFQGTVERIGIESDRVNEERRIYISCRNCPEAFFLGEQSEVLITTATTDAALLLPEAAVEFTDSSNGKVWIVQNGRLVRQPVKLGRRSSDGRIEIAGPIPHGATIVSAVRPGFADGQRVRIEPDK